MILSSNLILNLFSSVRACHIANLPRWMIAVCCLAPVVALTSGSVKAQPTCTGNCAIIDGDSVFIGTDGNGDGALSIENGDTLTLPNFALVGRNGPDEGRMLVTGAGSLFELGGIGTDSFFVVGRGGATGILTITDDGTVINNGSFQNPNGDQTAIRIGSDGFGTLDVLNGASFINQSSTGLADLNVGLYFSEDLVGPDYFGVANVDGPGSSILVSGPTGASIGVGIGFIDETGTGALNITNGGSVRVESSSGLSFVNVGVGTVASLTIDGPGSVLSVVGGADNASVSIGIRGNSLDPDVLSSIAGQGTLQVTNSGLLEILGPASQTDALNSLNIGFGRSDGLAYVGSGGVISVPGGAVTIGRDLQEDGSAVGTLIVDDTGLLDAAQLFVGDPNVVVQDAPYAFLRGTGTVRVSDRVLVSQGGLVSPGNDIGAVGSLRIEGDVIFGDNSVLEIDALETGVSDRLVVTGVADLAGTVRAISPDGEWSVARQYTILSADGGVVGSFDDVSSSLDYLVPSLTYTANTVQLNLSRLGAPVQEELLEESNAQQVSVTSRAVSTAIQSQVSSTIAAAFGSAVSPATAYAPGAVSTGLSAGDDASSGNIWLNFTPSSYKTDSILPGSNSAQKIDGDSWNLLIGADQLLAERYVVGAFVGAESADIDIDRIKGKQDNDGFMLGAYSGVAINDLFYASVNGNYSWLDYSVEERAFDAPEAVKGDFDSGRYSVGIDLNAVKVINSFDLRGQLGYNYTHEDYDSYNTSLGDRAQPEDQKLGRARLAVETSYLGERYRPYLSLAYENDVVTSIDLDDEDGFVAYAGIRSAVLREGLTIEAFLSAIFDRDDQDHNMFGLNLHYAW